METDRYGPVKAVRRRNHHRPGLAAMETDRYGPVKERWWCTWQGASQRPQWRPTATGR